MVHRVQVVLQVQMVHQDQVELQVHQVHQAQAELQVLVLLVLKVIKDKRVKLDHRVTLVQVVLQELQVQ